MAKRVALLIGPGSGGHDLDLSRPRRVPGESVRREIVEQGESQQALSEIAHHSTRSFPDSGRKRRPSRTGCRRRIAGRKTGLITDTCVNAGVYGINQAE